MVEHVLSGRSAAFLNFDVEVDKARFFSVAALAPLDGLRALGNPEVLVIDEAQRLPETARIVKGWHDVRLPVKLLLLGSSSLNLLDQAAESLAGTAGRPCCSRTDTRRWSETQCFGWMRGQRCAANPRCRM